MREERTLLGDVADAAFLARDEAVAGVVDHFGTQLHFAGIKALEAGDDAQQGRLAAARRTQDGREAAGGDLEVDPVEDLGATAAERLGHPADDQVPHCRTIVAGGKTPAAVGAGRQTGEPPPEDVAGNRREQHHHAGVRGGLLVREIGLVVPELGGQGLHAGRVQDQGGREFRRRLQEDEAEGGRQARPDQRQGDAPEDRVAADAEGEPDLFEAEGRAPTEARPIPRPSGRT